MSSLPHRLLLLVALGMTTPVLAQSESPLFADLYEIPSSDEIILPTEDPLFPTLDSVAGFWDRVHHDIDLSKEDYRNYYTWRNFAWFAGGLGAAAPFANTRLDRDIYNAYHDNFHGRNLDDLADVVNVAGQFWFVIPLAMEVSAWHGWQGEDYYFDEGFREWGHRSLRAVAVGFPPVVALYGLLGGERPDHGQSHWRPFQNIRGVSGHSFMGAVPFLTAASMTDDPFLKGAFIAGSFATGWSRIHKQRHFFSQVALGWWMAFLAVRSVNETHGEHRRWHLMPSMTEDPGIAIHIEF